MARKKKTIKIADFIDIVNLKLALPEGEYVTQEWKGGICSLTTQMLLREGVYNGFCFVDNDDCEIGEFGYVTRKYFKQ
jgi:hypothetical protein